VQAERRKSQYYRMIAASATRVRSCPWASAGSVDSAVLGREPRRRRARRPIRATKAPGTPRPQNCLAQPALGGRGAQREAARGEGEDRGRPPGTAAREKAPKAEAEQPRAGPPPTSAGAAGPAPREPGARRLHKQPPAPHLLAGRRGSRWTVGAAASRAEAAMSACGAEAAVGRFRCTERLEGLCGQQTQSLKHHVPPRPALRRRDVRLA
jgi:hypothetical protein